MHGYANRISFPTLPEHDHIGWWIAASRSGKYQEPDGLRFARTGWNWELRGVGSRSPGREFESWNGGLGPSGRGSKGSLSICYSL